MMKHFPRLHLALLAYWATLLAALYLFAQLADEVYEKEGFPFDEPILTWLNAVATPTLTNLALALSFIGSVYVLTPLLVLIFALLWRVSQRSAIFFVLGFVGAVALNYGAKAFFGRLRPDLFPQVTSETSFSFPSGHAMGSTAFFLSLYFVVRQLAPKWQWLAGLVGFLLALGISLSRPYLQVHYPSDILAGWSLSGLWVLGMNLWYVQHYRKKEHSRLK
jgi:membrane-associated phospholipid phosphatase